MKTIKIILGIIIVLSVVFFATGLIVKETFYNVEVLINKPIKKVFLDFENPKILKQWVTEIKSITPTNKTTQKVGTTYKMIVEHQGKEATIEKKIIAYTPNEKMTFRFTTDGMLRTDDYTFVSDSTNTKIIQKSTVKSNSYILACVFPWFKGRLKTLSKNQLNLFKKVVETDAVSVSK